MKTIEQMTRALYDQIARPYNETFPIHAHPEHVELFIKYLPKNARVLDVGCAGGRDTNYFAKSGLRATGLDFSTGQISYARNKYPGTDFVQGNILNLPEYFSPNEFDGVFTYAAVDHLKKN